ncbi:pectinesterase family protein [Niallia sp.]|uniref:pectinesterase family protein n=1 Tax=Niallia sp. TaxID=2837523 RepID=UPI0028969443|nr:pectinesterase family protein [Niallia sp.]
MGNFFNEAFVRNPLQFVIGKNKSCDFTSIQEALTHCSNIEKPITFIILSGEYNENIFLYQSNRKLLGIGTVRIIGNKYARQLDDHGCEIGTFQTATLFINAENVWMENIEIVNNAGHGEAVGQAVALYNEGNEVIFKNCLFKGFQDTICLGPLPDVQKDGTPFSKPEIIMDYPKNRVTFIHCYIEGTVDFIFGGGEAQFEGCELKSLNRPNNQPGYITAASTPNGKKGFLFSNCYITADPNVANVYLGRPWRPYANVTFSQCRVGSHIHSDRWDDWGKKENRETVTYRESKNSYFQKSPVKKIEWIQIETE